MVSYTHVYIGGININKVNIHSIKVIPIILFLISISFTVSADGFISPKISVNSNSVYISYEPDTPQDTDNLHYQKYDLNGERIQSKSIISTINFKGTAQAWIDYDVGHYNNNFIVVYPNPSVYPEVNIFFTMISDDSIKEYQITNDIKQQSWQPKVCLDTDGNMYVFYWTLSKGHGIFLSKVDSKGNIMINSKEIINDGEQKYYPIDVLIRSNTLLLHFSADHAEGFLIKLDLNGTKLSNETPFSTLACVQNLPVILDEFNNLVYLNDNGIVDTHNNIHITTSNSASLLYTKLNRTGAKLIENKTIATHGKKKNYDHGPVIFDPKVAIDSEDNIHITWYINDGSNHFSIWYEKIDPNGTVLIPAMKIAPEAEKGKDSTPGFELLPLIMITVVAAAMMRRRR